MPLTHSASHTASSTRLPATNAAFSRFATDTHSSHSATPTGTMVLQLPHGIQEAGCSMKG